MKAILAAFALTFTFATASNALPISPLIHPSNTIQVAGGCEAEWHRGPYGGCRRNWAHPGIHACPRGYHIGPGGRCRGNWR